MQLYIMRHGEAEGVMSPNSRSDSQRALTTIGESEAKLMAKWFSDMKIDAQHIFVSPYVRAQQTCRTINQELNSPITTLDFISPLDDAKSVHDFIDGWIHEFLQTNPAEKLAQTTLVFVSHMPLVSFLVAQLTQPTNMPIFATGAVAHVDYDIEKMQGLLVNLVSPYELS